MNMVMKHNQTVSKSSVDVARYDYVISVAETFFIMTVYEPL